MGCIGAMRRFFLLLLSATVGFPAIAQEPPYSFHFWEPKLPDDQKFVVMWRSIKSYGISEYDLYHDEEAYPVIELLVELTHSKIRFLHIENSRGRPVPLSLEEIAKGELAQHKGFLKRGPSKPPPTTLERPSRKPIGYSNFRLNHAQEIYRLYEELHMHLKHSFPR